MCGIVGIFGNIDHREIIVKRMADIIKHRGPDDEGFYNDDYVSFGHRRLSIIDLSNNGKQPICNEDKNVWVIFNGEIYNYEILKEELIKKGHQFSSKTDTEILVHGYEEEGIDFLKRLNGIFSIALWDKQNQKMFLARDPMGVKPLYYSFFDEGLGFASEIKSLVQSGLMIPKLNEQSMYKFMFYRYIPDKNTIFEEVYKLLRGEILEFSTNGSKYLDIIKRKYHAPETNLTIKYSKELKEKINKGVIQQLMSDVPVGVFLSGGLDSSIVTANAALQDQKKIQSFSVQFDTNDSLIKSEIKFARIVSDKFLINSHKLIVRESEILERLPEIAWHYDEPMGDAATIPTFFVSEFAKNNVKVILAGEGGDEQFAGYTKYEKMHRIFDLSPEEIARINLKEIGVFMPSQLNKLFKNFDHNSFESNLINFTKKQFENKSETLSCMLEFDQDTMLCENYLMKADKMSMAHSIEERVPLLDLNLVNFSQKIPSSLKLHEGCEKYILKKSAVGLLPAEILDRKKQGYGTPTKCWFKGKIGKLFKHRIKDSVFFNKYCNLDYIHELIDNHINEFENNNTKLWNLLAFDLWYEIYIVKNESKPKQSYFKYFNLSQGND